MKHLVLTLVAALALTSFAEFPAITPRNALNFVSYDATAFGFQENLRTNQVVKGTALVDRVISFSDARGQVVKAGDYKYVVTGFVVDAQKGIKGFSAVSATAPAATLITALEAYVTSGTIPTVQPTCDRVVFVTYKGNTFSLYKNAQ